MDAEIAELKRTTADSLRLVRGEAMKSSGTYNFLSKNALSDDV